MGIDKALLPFGSSTLAAHMVARIRPWVDEVVMAARVAQKGLPDVPAVYDTAVDGGPLPALTGALPVLRHDHILVVAVDTPLLVPELIPMLHDRMGENEVSVPWVRGYPVMALSVVSRAAVLRAAPMLGDRAGLRDLLPLVRAVKVSEDELRVVDPQLQSFLPCNTPDELLAIRGTDDRSDDRRAVPGR
jgi:molybdopterin-guanine dinucleotide biosynthesis protein A